MTRILCWLCLPFFSSCGIIGLKRHVDKMESLGAVSIQVTPPPDQAAPSYAFAWTFDGEGPRESAGFQPLRADGIAAFSLRTDRIFRVGAFTDENRNGKYDAGEPAAFQKDVRPVDMGQSRLKVAPYKLRLHRDLGFPPGTVIEVPKENKALGNKINVALGDVVSLDEKRFAADAGGGGLWRPLDFLNLNTTGLYFVEPYDPKRIPVIFVYGIGGSPQDWRYFMENFDRKRHQLWFYHYPSGIRLDRSSTALANSIRVLRQRHSFDTCIVVAHSMGGLVAHAAITKAVAAEGTNFIPEFVSISTPWGGHQAAESGVRHMRKPVPSWKDVVPDSDYLTQLYATPLPSGTRHLLICGSIKKDSPFWMKGENDGVVTLASETDPRIKKHATTFHHLPYEHVEILNSKETLRLVRRF